MNINAETSGVSVVVVGETVLKDGGEFVMRNSMLRALGEPYFKPL